MKVSNKILWFGLGGVFGCVVALVLFLRISATPMMGEGQETLKMNGSRTPVKQSYPIKYFSGIHASGKWNLVLEQGEAYAVEIEAPEYVLKGLIVEKEQSVLRLDVEKGRRFGRREISATIRFPALDSLRLSGSINVDMQGFQSQRLKIKASGSTNLKGSNNKIHDLTLKGSGSTEIELRDNPVTYAEIDLSGSSKVSVSMAGGDLKGSISGSGTVVYDGDIRDQEVRISGSGSVKRRKKNS